MIRKRLLKKSDRPWLKREELLKRLDQIEEGVNQMKVPAFFADQFYVLREHIRFVHRRLMEDRHVH